MRGHNFLNYIMFLTISNALDLPIGGVQVCSDTKKNGALPLDLDYLECLSVIIATPFSTNEQLKDLTHILCLRIPCYKLYKEGLFYYVLPLIYMCHFGMNLKKLNLKVKHKI